MGYDTGNRKLRGVCGIRTVLQCFQFLLINVVCNAEYEIHPLKGLLHDLHRQVVKMWESRLIPVMHILRWRSRRIRSVSLRRQKDFSMCTKRTVSELLFSFHIQVHGRDAKAVILQQPFHIGRLRIIAEGGMIEMKTRKYATITGFMGGLQDRFANYQPKRSMEEMVLNRQ